MTRLGILALLVLAAACTPRGKLAYGEAPEGASVRDIFVVEYRESNVLPGDLSPARPTNAKHAKLRVSIPPGRSAGELNLPGRRPDPGTDMIVTETTEYPDLKGFAKAVAAAQPGLPESLLFVHGYNINHAEAVYRMAQIAEDFDAPAPPVVFSWPSAAVPQGYIYDRDSVLFSRDRLDTTIRELSKRRKLVVVAHSMGTQLVMETLRQLDMSGFDVAGRINALILLSPDIDRDVFRAQVEEMDALPDPFVIVASSEDRILRLSAFLTGRGQRVGSKADRSYVEGLPITIIDVSNFSDGAFDHSVVTGSPAAISIIRRIRQGRRVSTLQLPDLLVLGQGPANR